jgi:hypothetical protein
MAGKKKEAVVLAYFSDIDFFFGETYSLQAQIWVKKYFLKIFRHILWDFVR